MEIDCEKLLSHDMFYENQSHEKKVDWYSADKPVEVHGETCLAAKR